MLFSLCPLSAALFVQPHINSNNHISLMYGTVCNGRLNFICTDLVKINCITQGNVFNIEICYHKLQTENNIWIRHNFTLSRFVATWFFVDLFFVFSSKGHTLQGFLWQSIFLFYLNMTFSNRFMFVRCHNYLNIKTYFFSFERCLDNYLKMSMLFIAYLN